MSQQSGSPAPKQSVWWLLLNVASFQLCWFSLLLIGDQAVPWVIAWLIGHWSLSSSARSDRYLMGVFAALGLVAESFHLHSGVLILPNHAGPVPPLWLIAFWPLFATLLNHSLRWLVAKPLLGSALAGAGGWASYYAGAQIAGGELTSSTSFIIAIEWAILFYLSATWLVPKSFQFTR
ncbi:DUF2878 domain-containing protein [Neiella marina]|uniref:DUF2878 domain-containing protein n=1 Tax=Neiella holothuriorum TaxID=2870530 RepID=A0ABS7EHU8_9GAMM|nr:DUF2878 domain-containing protein [Neiella holothuriorum]MBW8191922.1 DUF2878 domain-containing protein [Neiella holothuriorum]